FPFRYTLLDLGGSVHSRPYTLTRSLLRRKFKGIGIRSDMVAGWPMDNGMFRDQPPTPPRPERFEWLVSEVSSVTRKCGTCQHIKRAEIDRRLAAGEPGSQIARDYHLNPSSLHRHRVNCLGLSSSNAIMKEVARGTAAVTCLPSKEALNNAYFELRERIDQIVTQAEQQG